MSAQHQRALYNNPDLTATETSVLVRMASHIRQRDGSAIFASIDDTQAATKYSRRAVFKVVSDAKRWGILIPTGKLRNRKVVYRMSLDAINSFKGALSAPYKGAGGAPSTVQGVHPTESGKVHLVHSKGAPGAAKGAGGAPFLKEEFLLTPDGLRQDEVSSFPGHQEFHRIEGVDSECDFRCDRIKKWGEDNPDLVGFLPDAAGAVADQVRYDPEGGKRSRPPKPWYYEGKEKRTRYSDIVAVVTKWARRRGNEGSPRNNGRRSASHMGNTVEDVAAAEREVRGGNR